MKPTPADTLDAIMWAAFEAANRSDRIEHNRLHEAWEKLRGEDGDGR